MPRLIKTLASVIITQPSKSPPIKQANLKTGTECENLRGLIGTFLLFGVPSARENTGMTYPRSHLVA